MFRLYWLIDESSDAMQSTLLVLLLTCFFSNIYFCQEYAWGDSRHSVYIFECLEI
jgi:uncharacterized membrane protein